jgi:outer membrane protein insertion porin family/translocation and assembly module TamA
MPRRRALLALGFVVAVLSVATPATARAQDIACDRGDLEVVDVRFVGNQAFTDAQLAIGLVTTPSSWARRVFRKIGTRRCLDTLEVRRDPLRLLYLYNLRGFRGTIVTARVDTVRKSAVKVTFGIREGYPIILDEMTITGLDSVPRGDRIVAGLPIKVGERFDLTAVEASRETIVRRLRDNGYPSAELFRSYETDSAKRTATLKLDIATGPRARIGAVKVTVTPQEGQRQQISPDRVRRTLGFEPGELYRERDLEEAKRALFLSGAYRHVEVSTDTASLRPEGDSTIDVNVSLAESFMRSIRPSVGWATLDCFRTQVDYSDYGFLGALRRLDVTARASKIGVGYPTEAGGLVKDLCKGASEDTYSDTVNYYVGATLRQSSLFGVRAIPTVTLYSELRSEYKVFRRYTPVGAILSLSQALRGRIGATYAYQLEYGRTAAEPAIFCGVIGICDVNEQDFLRRSQRLATASVAVGRDRRNDVFYPTAGSSMTLELRSASQFIGSDPDLQFKKVVADASWYWALPRNSVFVARLRGGLVFGQRITLGSDTTVFIPQQERLYAGGATTVRGFRQNELGPVVYLPNTEPKVCTAPRGECVEPATDRDTVYFSSGPARESDLVILPVGGNSVAVANVELRMPSPFIPDRLQVAFFADAGQVWTRGGTGAEQSFGNMKVTPGIGVRVASPVGPIRLDIGYNPYQRPLGAAYFDAPPKNGIAPLYCVSPGNALPVTGWKKTPGRDDDPPLQANSGRGCPTSYSPLKRSSFIHRLTFQASIGQAF